MDADILLEVCEAALNRKEDASLPDYLATYLEMFLYFILNAFTITWKHMSMQGKKVYK